MASDTACLCFGCQRQPGLVSDSGAPAVLPQLQEEVFLSAGPLQLNTELQKHMSSDDPAFGIMDGHVNDPPSGVPEEIEASSVLPSPTGPYWPAEIQSSSPKGYPSIGATSCEEVWQSLSWRDGQRCRDRSDGQ